MVDWRGPIIDRFAYFIREVEGESTITGRAACERKLADLQKQHSKKPVEPEALRELLCFSWLLPSEHQDALKKLHDEAQAKARQSLDKLRLSASKGSSSKKSKSNEDEATKLALAMFAAMPQT